MSAAWLKKIVFVFILIAANANSYAQNVKAFAKLDSSAVLIGDQVHLKVSVELPASYILHWPALSDTLTKSIEVIARSKFDTVYSADRTNSTISQTLTLTCFDSGYFAIPPVAFMYQKPGDTTKRFAQTGPVMIMVRNLAVDTTAEFKDIKPPLKAPLTFREILPWLLLALGIMLLAGLGIYVYLRLKNKKALIVLPSKPKIPAHITALAELEKLRIAHLWQYGKTKEYHSRLSDILRTYIEGRFGVIAMEMITIDILETLALSGISTDDRDLLRKVLQMTDMVKFAKFEPLPDENDLAMKNAVAFVTRTKQEDKANGNSSATDKNSNEPVINE